MTRDDISTIAAAGIFGVTFSATFTVLVAVGGAVIAVRAIKAAVR